MQGELSMARSDLATLQGGGVTRHIRRAFLMTRSKSGARPRAVNQEELLTLHCSFLPLYNVTTWGRAGAVGF